LFSSGVFSVESAATRGFDRTRRSFVTTTAILPTGRAAAGAADRDRDGRGSGAIGGELAADGTAESGMVEPGSTPEPTGGDEPGPEDPGTSGWLVPQAARPTIRMMARASFPSDLQVLRWRSRRPVSLDLVSSGFGRLWNRPSPWQ
jgi:hypothetical protein